MADEETPAPADTTADEGEDVGNDTIFLNLYRTSILPPWKDASPKEGTKKRLYRTPRDYTIALTDDNADEFGNITHVGWKSRVDYYLGEYEEKKKRAVACINDVYRNPNRLLEVAVSTIILMASGSDSIPMENYLYTELYLKNIRDDNGDHPPNISKLLKHMRFLKKQYDIKWEEEFKAAPPDNLIITKITKKSRIPVKINRTVNSTFMSNISSIPKEDVTAEEAEPPAEEE